MARILTPLLLVALATLPGCGLFLPRENEWKFGDPPPEPVSTGGTIEGEVRDLRTLRPLVGAEIVVTTGRKGYERREVTDALGRFVISYSMKARDHVPAGEVIASQLLFGSDPSDDTVDDLRVTVTCRGRRPRVERGENFRHTGAVFYLEPIDPELPARFECGP